MSVLELLASSPTTLVLTCLVLGLTVGSFLNVVIYRLPIMLDRSWREQCAQVSGEAAARTLPASPPQPFNLVVPRSACPACQAPISAWHCASCGQPISVRYPLVEALSGALCAVVAWRLGFGWPTFAAMLLTWFLIVLAFIDIDHQLLPDDLTLPLLWLGLLLSVWGREGGAPIPVDVRSSLLGAMVGYASLWSVYHLFRLLTGKEGMGYGDFKLFAALGAWLGWQMLLPIILMAAAVGSVVGIALIALRGRNRSTPIAFGPFLAAAGWLMLMFGQPLLAAYLGLFTARP
jgi:leader peptidase (prepilin peptidase) / N-methyltransferase